MSAILSLLSGLAGDFKLKAQRVVDSLFPPEKRAELLSKLQTWAVSNPKLSAFLLTNIALTGLPLVLFAVFTLTVFVFSLIVALLVALVAALLFTVFMVLVALVIVLPTVFMTTMAASFIFLWGLGGYYIVKWFNDSQEGSTPSGDAIGDKLNNLTGGKLSFLMDGARKKEAGENGDSTNKTDSPSAPSPEDAKGAVQGATKQADGVTKRANKSTGGAAKPVTNTAGSAKGVVGGVTGLG